MGWRFGQSYSGGHLSGQIIMSILANRVRKGHGHWLKVIEQVPQHMAENELPPLEFPSLWTPEFVKLLHAVEGIYDGSTPDLSKGALYWASLSRIQRPWFRDRILELRNPLTGGLVHNRIGNINDLNFFD